MKQFNSILKNIYVKINKNNFKGEGTNLVQLNTDINNMTKGNTFPPKALISEIKKTKNRIVSELLEYDMNQSKLQKFIKNEYNICKRMISGRETASLSTTSEYRATEEQTTSSPLSRSLISPADILEKRGDK